MKSQAKGNYVIKRKRPSLFGQIVETLGADGHFYLQITAGVRNFTGIGEARKFGRTIDNKHGSLFIEGPQGGRYDI